MEHGSLRRTSFAAVTTRRRLAAIGAAVAVAALVLAGCGDGSGDADSSPVEVELVAGEAVLPAPDDPLLAGSSIESLRAPADLTPEAVGSWNDDTPGRVVLYGDAELEDPFEGPWVFAVLLDGSEMSGLGGGFDARGTDTEWVDVPVESLSQEGRYAGLLAGGIDRAAATDLGEAVEVSTDGDAPGAIEIPASALRAASDRLEPLVAADVDAAFLGASGGMPGVVPTVGWSRGGEDDWSRLMVSSWADRPGLELLLRATTGGATTGPNVMPVGGEGATDQIVALRVVGGTLAHVQAQQIPVDELAAFADRLSPAAEQRWVELRDARFLQPALSPYLPDAQVVLDEVFGDVRLRSELAVTPMQGEWGPFDACMTSSGFQLRSGLGLPSGGTSAGGCPEFGEVQLVSVGERTIVHGVATPSTERVQVVLASGEVHEPELQGDAWRLYAAEVAGVGAVVEVRAIAADGSVIGRLGADPSQVVGSLSTGGGRLQPPG